MKPDLNDIDELLEQHLPSASAQQVENAGMRVLHRLRSHDRSKATEFEGRLDAIEVPVRTWRPTVMTWAAAAAVVAMAISVAILWRPANHVAVVTAVDASLSRDVDGKTETLPQGSDLETGQPVRTTGDAGAVLQLADGSSVEMRSRSELAVEKEVDGLGIQLHQGSIIVHAAKQRNGHLYVKTRDVTVSVVGTVFLVNAEKEGSRVGVIEGEVRVREGDKKDTSLRPGQQVSTNASLVTRPLKEEIAWSRNNDALVKILDTFTRGMAQTAGPLTPVRDRGTASDAAGQSTGAVAVPEFEEASIRACDPNNVPEAPAGARGGGPNSLQMTPGRLHALCLTLATIIRHAYGYGPANLDFLNPGGRGPGLQLSSVYGLGVEDGKRVRGGPDWVRSDHYTIDAVAADAADAAAMMGPMVRALLEKRFQLKVHIETEQLPAWNLTIASSGLKIKPVKTDAVDNSGFVTTAGRDGGACELPPTIGRGQPAIVRPAQPGERQPPPPSTPGQPVTILFRHFADVRRGEKPTCGMSMQRNGPNQVIVAGGTTLEALARSLASPLGGIVVTDKTGNTDKFNVVLEFVRDENTPGPSFLQRPDQPDQPSDVPRGQTIFAALEEQLGLKLEPARAPRDFIVIDHVERPTAN
jgi:uncharacterized protein (TIGR03435 family)